MKKITLIIFILVAASDLWAASALPDRGSYLKIHYGTVSRRVENGDCVGEYTPSLCCTGVDTGICNTEVYYRQNIDCTAAGVPYTCCTGDGTGTCEDVYNSEQQLTPGVATATVNGSFSIGTTYYFSSKAYTTKPAICKTTPCESYYSNEASWVADSATTVTLEWDTYGYDSYVLSTDNTFVIKFDEPVYTSSADDSEFTFAYNCDDCTISYQGGSGTNTLTYLISGTIDRFTESPPYLYYTPVASIEDGTGTPVDAFGDYILLESDTGLPTNASKPRVIFIQ